MEINGKTYRNLESQVAYLTDVWNNQIALNEMGIKVIGHVDTESEIPDGTYEYGDAYMVGTEVPYTMYVWTRADLSHSSDYWFNVGKFPLPGPKGDTGDSLKISAIGATSITTANYENQEGIVGIMSRTVAYDNGDEGDINESYTIPLTVNTNDFTIKPQTDSPRINLDLNHTKLATKYWKVIAENESVPFYYNGQQKSKPITNGPKVWSLVQTNSNGAIKCNIMSDEDNSMVSAHSVVKSVLGNNYQLLQVLGYISETGVYAHYDTVFKDRANPPMNILMADEEVFNSTTYPNKRGILHLSNYQCPVSGLHEYTYTTQIPGYYIVYKITDESNGQDTSSDLWSMNRSIYKMGTEVQPSEI